MIGIVEEARSDIIDNAPGRRRYGGNATCQLDRITVAYQAAQ